MDYKDKILTTLVKKYNRRKLKYKEQEIKKRISMKPREIYKKYASNKGDMQIEKAINQSIDDLESFGFIAFKKELYSYDVSKIYLMDQRIDEINTYLFEQYGIASRDLFIIEAKKQFKKYKKEGPFTKFYVNQLMERIENTLIELDLAHEEQILLALDFIQKNKKHLYIREASLLIYGSSKIFEEKSILDPVCNVIRQVLNKPKSEYESNDDILKEFYISNVDQEIKIKGDITIEFEDYAFEIKHFKDGISLTSSDIDRIQFIKIHTKNFMTIENKTSLYRFNNSSFSTLYLGGYANRYQIAFLKKVNLYNPQVNYYHFGDIDVGGYLIHQHLSNSTGISFGLFKMGVEELKDSRYQSCLQKISENDQSRAQSLLKEDLYKEQIQILLKEKIKLEQEIISLTFDEDINFIKCQ